MWAYLVGFGLPILAHVFAAIVALASLPILDILPTLPAKENDVHGTVFILESYIKMAKYEIKQI